MQTAHTKAVTHDLPIELQARLDKLREDARQQNVSQETLMIHETRVWVTFLHTLWPAGGIPSSRVDWLNAQCPEFQLNVELVNSTTVLKHITPANIVWLHDGKYLAFVRRITQWVWERIQTHREEEEEEKDDYSVADYDLYHVPALRGSKYGRRLRTG
jgi:hypothetical protein